MPRRQEKRAANQFLVALVALRLRGKKLLCCLRHHVFDFAYRFPLVLYCDAV